MTTSSIQEVRNCGDCGAKPGELHQLGCDVERCVLCGGQAISCYCVYELNGMPTGFDDLEDKHPDIFENGPTEAMLAIVDKAVKDVGGRLPWTGEWPGCAECREFGFWCRWSDTPGSSGWKECDKDHPDAREDLNRLNNWNGSLMWSKEKRRWVKR